VDSPGYSSKLGAWTFWLAGDYYIHVRTQIKCVSGPDSGKVYWTISWGGYYHYDNTPVLYPTLVIPGDSLTLSTGSPF